MKDANVQEQIEIMKAVLTIAIYIYSNIYICIYIYIYIIDGKLSTSAPTSLCHCWIWMWNVVGTLLTASSETVYTSTFCFTTTVYMYAALNDDILIWHLQIYWFNFTETEQLMHSHSNLFLHFANIERQLHKMFISRVTCHYNSFTRPTPKLVAKDRSLTSRWFRDFVKIYRQILRYHCVWLKSR